MTTQKRGDSDITMFPDTSKTKLKGGKKSQVNVNKLQKNLTRLHPSLGREMADELPV